MTLCGLAAGSTFIIATELIVPGVGLGVRLLGDEEGLCLLKLGYGLYE